MYGSENAARVRALAAGVWRVRNAVKEMVLREVRAKYSNTKGGLFWALLQPLSTAFIFWFVFSVGFRSVGPHKTAYIVYFITGYVAWHFLQDVVNGGVNALRANAFLIKKTNFSIEAVLVTKFLVALCEHAIFLVVVVLVVAANGAVPAIKSLALLPYSVLSVAFLATTLMLLAATASVISPDLGQGVSVLLGVWFWLTPIVWVPDTIHPSFLVLADYNPMAHVMESYRQSLAYGDAFAFRLSHALFFWTVAIALVASALAFHLRYRASVIDSL